VTPGIAGGSWTGTAAADEVDDFQAVSIFEQRFRPAVAGDDVTVEFHRDAVGLHFQRLD